MCIVIEYNESWGFPLNSRAFKKIPSLASSALLARKGNSKKLQRLPSESRNFREKRKKPCKWESEIERKRSTWKQLLEREKTRKIKEAHKWVYILMNNKKKKNDWEKVLGNHDAANAIQIQELLLASIFFLNRVLYKISLIPVGSPTPRALDEYYYCLIVVVVVV